MSKLISFLLVGLFIGTSYHFDGIEEAFQMGIGSIFILALIWFGDEMGLFIGPTSRGSITAVTPGWMLRGFGWIVLILAAIASVLRIAEGA